MERRAPRARTTASWCRARAVLPYPQPPAGLTKEHIRVALTAQGVRYAVLAQVGTSEATPAFRLSAPSLEQGSISGPPLVSRARGVGVRPDGQHWRVYFSFFCVFCPFFLISREFRGVPRGRRRRGRGAAAAVRRFFLKKIKIKIRKKDAHR